MLSTTPLRKDAVAIFEAGLDAVETRLVVKNQVRLEGGFLYIGRKKFRLSKFRRIYVIGIGKASHAAAQVLEDILDDRITDGIVIDAKNGSLKRIKFIEGTHPLPSEVNLRATGEIIGLLKSLDSQDLLISIISGGGSALMSMPYTLEYETMRELTDLLMKKGATIEELNTVRKHICEIKGGQFARMAHPATIISLIFSDVPGDDISLIGSGPTVLDTSTVDDAMRVLDKYKAAEKYKIKYEDLCETPKDPLVFENVYNFVLVSNKLAIEAMGRKARELGYKPRVFSTELQGEARDVGKKLAIMTKAGEALIAGGETTVTVKRPGKGGRNQEVAIGALDHLAKLQLVASLNSDGKDHTDIAGGIADVVTLEKAQRKGISARKALQMNQAHDFLVQTQSYFRTGRTGINVSDLMLSLRKKTP